VIELRDYQNVLIEGARANIRAGVKRQVLVAPTGSGKTVIAAFMQGRSAQRGARSWFVVHRKEIIEQTAITFGQVGIPHGFVVAGEQTDRTPLVHLCGVQTLANRLDDLDTPELIVWDECHHVAAASWSTIMQRFPDAYHIGLSATPERLDGKGLKEFFDRLVVGPTTGELIRRGFLSPYRYFAPTQPDLTGVATTAGDFNRAQLAGVMGKPTIIGDAFEHYQRLAPGKRAIIFAVSRDHSREVVARFNAEGVPALHVDGAMPKTERKAAFDRFRSGDVCVLSNVDLAGEGVDIPAIEAAILLRPTKSLSLHLQQVGRALRLFDGKTEAVILDHASNALLHGLPDDERQWSLEGRKRGKRAAGANDSFPIRQCIECYRVSPSTADHCPGCGVVFPARARPACHEEGELFELTRLDAKRREKEERKAEERQCQSLQDWMLLGKKRGYSRGWAFHQWNVRQRYRRAG
jgi:DNA repair protein RadD